MHAWKQGEGGGGTSANLVLVMSMDTTNAECWERGRSKGCRVCFNIAQFPPNRPYSPLASSQHGPPLFLGVSRVGEHKFSEGVMA